MSDNYFGLHSKIEILDYVDYQDDLEIIFGEDNSEWINKQESIEIIKHLAKVFDLDLTEIAKENSGDKGEL